MFPMNVPSQQSGCCILKALEPPSKAVADKCNTEPKCHVIATKCNSAFPCAFHLFLFFLIIPNQLFIYFVKISISIRRRHVNLDGGGAYPLNA